MWFEQLHSFTSDVLPWLVAAASIAGSTYAYTSLHRSVAGILKLQNKSIAHVLNTMERFEKGQLRQLWSSRNEQHDGLINHRDKINALIESNNALVPDLCATKEQLSQLALTYERLEQINLSTIEAAGAAQRFWDALLGCGRVPEQELAELGKALAAWQAKGRLN